MTLAKKIYNYGISVNRPFNFSELNDFFEDEKRTTIRGRVYDNLGKYFSKVGKGVYVCIKNDVTALLVEGDGRNLSEINTNSIHAIITDHPWDCEKSNRGSNRNFIKGYENNVFLYKQEDFNEKFRVLINGGFLVENVPEENSNNFDYIYNIKKMAIKAGFKYYAQVPWKKGKFVSNTGRKSKNTEMLLFFTKGKPRNLRYDKQRSLLHHKECFMSGAKQMLPVEFNHQPKSSKKKSHAAEKPVSLLKEIIELITNKKEIILDQFSGSLNIILAAIQSKRNVIAYEKDSKVVEKGLTNINVKFDKIN